jgi:hypothetical protein
MIWALCLLAGQDLKLPAEVRGEVAAFVTVVAETTGKTVKFYPLDGGLSVFPAALLANPKATVVVAAKSGTYRLLAYTAAGDVPSDPQICRVVIGNGKPDDVKPPTPPPPQPDQDPLLESLVGIYGGLQEPNKQKHVQALADIYRRAAATVDQFADLGTLYSSIRRTASEVVPADAIRPIRERIAVETIRQLGDQPQAQLTPALSSKAASYFSRLGFVLEELGK